MQLRILFFVFIFPYFSLLSQDNGSAFTISGKITDDQGNTIPYANIALLQERDSTISAGVVSDDFGKFELHAKSGKYFLRITFLSFEEKIIANIIISNNPLDLGVIKLRTASKT